MIKPWIALLTMLVTVGGCAQLDAWTSTMKKGSAPAAPVGDTLHADALYLNPDAAAAARDFRNIYIAPANLANMQVIQPEGTSADIEWWVTDTEDQILQQAIAYEFTVALAHESAFYTVATPAEAQIIVDTAVVAIHPNVTRAAQAATASPGGAITVSVVLVNAATGAVLLRAVDTRSSADIWAFNQVDAGDLALYQIFRAWGNSLRLGLLQLQGRDPLAPSSVAK